ncbi:MAG: rhomboid family intramembrane serine protease [Bacteroidia bacterium]|nr:rhomboid family intramembrane serine protease [Bacteroidia bacterium]
MSPENLKTKLRIIFLPYLLVAVGTISGYCLLRWGLDFQLGIILFKDDMINLILPMVISFAMVWFWLRHRIRLLRVEGKQGNGYFGYQMVMAATIALPLIIGQYYLERVSFELIEVGSARNISDYPGEKFFSIRNYEIQPQKSLFYNTTRTSGRNNQELHFLNYRACPFAEANSVWFGVQFNETVSNRLADSAQDSLYYQFLARSDQEFEKYNFYNVAYFERYGYSDERDGFLRAILESRPQADRRNQVILKPVMESFSARTGSSGSWFLITLGGGWLIILLMVLIPKVDQKEFEKKIYHKTLAEIDFKSAISLLGPKGPFPITTTLIIVNAGIFLIMIFAGLNLFAPTPQELFEFGGQTRKEVLEGQYWRLITHMFIHAGLMHLFTNMFSLFFGVFLLEQIIGSFRLLLIYLAGGVFSGIVSLWWHDSGVGVGASGAIFCLYGLIFVFTVFKIFPKGMRQVAWLLLGLFAGIGLLLGAVIQADNAAHLGGVVFGIISGLPLILFQRKKYQEKAKKFNS